jgi:hypothetical protein
LLDRLSPCLHANRGIGWGGIKVDSDCAVEAGFLRRAGELSPERRVSGKKILQKNAFSVTRAFSTARFFSHICDSRVSRDSVVFFTRLGLLIERCCDGRAFICTRVPVTRHFKFWSFVSLYRGKLRLLYQYNMKLIQSINSTSRLSQSNLHQLSKTQMHILAKIQKSVKLGHIFS